MVALAAHRAAVVAVVVWAELRAALAPIAAQAAQAHAAKSG
jgi:hypothetical protein